MTKNYKDELDRLPSVYKAALNFDVSRIAATVELLFHQPLVAVGSGGSFSTASFAAGLHQQCTGQFAKAVTPYEIVSGNVPDNAATMCFSASGRNRDIGVAFKTAALEESGSVSALVLSEQTPLHKLSDRYQYTDVVGGRDNAFRDGFLAVASMIASSILLVRAYDQVRGNNYAFQKNYGSFVEDHVSCPATEIENRVEPVLLRGVTSVLYSPVVGPAAVDLESRFVEAALGSLHCADLRNFGHGRHHWMAKRPDETGVLALVSDQDAKLAGKTLALLPEDIPACRIDFEGRQEIQAIAALIAGLYVSEVAGKVSGIDPGKPGVPSFGRQLYRIGPGPIGRKTSEANKRAAIRRKSTKALRDPTLFETWSRAHDKAINVLASSTFGAVVFDYDGTICDHRHRFDPLQSAVGAALNGLLDRGIRVGVATGRGASAGIALRQVLPSSRWDDVIMGYYNGAKLTTLSNEDDDLVGDFRSPELIAALESHSMLKGAEFRSNEIQVSIRLPASIGTETAIYAVEEIMATHKKDVRIGASSHSIDVQFSNGTKSSVVDMIEAELPGGLEVLRIGDKGLPPGNDAQLLDSPFGISVDEVSQHVSHCWAHAPAGVKGVQATLYYLGKLNALDGPGGLRVSPGDRGVDYAT